MRQKLTCKINCDANLMQGTDNSASSKILPVVVSQRELRECHRGLLYLLTDWLASTFVMFDLVA